MNPRLWVPPLVFVATALPTIWLLHHFDLGGEFRLLIAMAVGVFATALAQSRLARRKDDG